MLAAAWPERVPNQALLLRVRMRLRLRLQQRALESER